MRASRLAGFRSAGRKRRAAAPTGNAGGDASRFAAPNLPPYREQTGAETQRAEPELDLSPDALAAKAAAAHYDAMYEDPAARSRRRSPMLLMALVFAVGTGAGLAGAKWFSSSQKSPALSAPAVALSAPVTTTVDADGEARALRGIRASELPYDGRPPEKQDEESVQHVAKAPVEDAPPAPAPKAAAPDASPAPLAKAPEPKAAVPEPRAAAPEPRAAAPEPKAAAPEQKSREPEAKTAGRETRSGPKPAQNQPRQSERAQAEDSRGGQSKQAQRSESDTRKAAARTARSGRDGDGEVERMRRQADDELNKKSASASTPQRRGGGEPSRLQQVSSALASCERRANIILREHCRWQVCNGMWGKNGCPSYASARRDPYAY